jgi:hypothetical protein
MPEHDGDHFGFEDVHRFIEKQCEGRKELETKSKEQDVEFAKLRKALATIGEPKREPEYSTLVRLIEHGQMNRWQTLQMFRLFQSLLFVGWTNLFRGMVADFTAALNPTLARKDLLSHTWQTVSGILLAISLVGCLTALVWRAIAPDYTAALKLYTKKVIEYEKQFPDGMKTLTEHQAQICEKTRIW